MTGREIVHVDAHPAEVVQALQDVLHERGIKLYAVVDHGHDMRDAGAAGFTAWTLVFGNPAAGAQLLAHDLDGRSTSRSASPSSPRITRSRGSSCAICARCSATATESSPTRSPASCARWRTRRASGSGADMARVFITGSADGLGQLAARRLIADGHEVVVHGRSPERAREAQEAVGAAAATHGDLASLAQTRALADQANAAGPYDAVIHNAGSTSPGRRSPPGTASRTCSRSTRSRPTCSRR